MKEARTLPGAELIDFLRHVATSRQYGWVLFDAGTFVLVPREIPGRAGYAKFILDRYGPVTPGTPSGDFDVHELSDIGWLVTYSNPRMMTFVSRGTVIEALGPRESYSELDVGLVGRKLREVDAQTKIVIHIEPPTDWTEDELPLISRLPPHDVDR